MRTLDKSKKSNIKCEHCKYRKKAPNTAEKPFLCWINNKPINYWNKCSSFEWNEKYS